MRNFSCIGNVGKDPQEVKANGKTIAKFSVAVTERRGEKKTTTWFDCASFGKQADTVVKYLKKGARVFVSGIPEIRDWEDKDGNKRKSFSVIANQVIFLDKRPTSMEATKQDSEPVFDESEELPF